MESDILNELFDTISYLASEGDTSVTDVKELIEYIQEHEFFDEFLEAMADVNREIFVEDQIHGISHNERVALIACAIGMKEGLSQRELRLLLEAAKYHDIGRKDKPTEKHGKVSADIIEKLRGELFADFSDDEVNVIKALCEGHGVKDEDDAKVIASYGIKDTESCQRILSILKDADALDRVRLPRFGKLNTDYLRTEVARELVPTAKSLLERYNAAKETIHYDRGAVSLPFDAGLFDMSAFNVIEDDEYFYVFRTLNEDNERELDDDYEKYLRTSRERQERKSQEVRYTAESKISLAEVYDNIKYSRGDKDTNCISFSTNTNVSLDYLNDRYVMLRVPKDNMGQLVVSGKYMLEEIGRQVEAKIEELLKDEVANKEILALISQINASESTEEMVDVVTRSYKDVKDVQEKYTGSKSARLSKASVKRRFADKQYLTEEQQFEYNRLVAKLTVLETRGKLRSILPNQPTNSALISSIGIAFSSSEMIHYREVPKAEVVEVSKENMEMFALLQQAESIPSVNKEMLEDLKRDFLFAVQEGYELRMLDGKIVYSNKIHRIELGTIDEFDGVFDSIEVDDNTPIEDAYHLLRKKVDQEEVIPYVKGKAAIDFTRKLAIAKLKNNQYWRILAKITPDTEEVVDAVSKLTIATNPDIVSRLNNSGSKLIESVNIDIPDQNLRRLFTSAEIEALWYSVSALSDDELRKVLSEDYDFFKNGYFDNLIDGKKYPNGEKEYYTDTIVDALDLTKVYTHLTPGSDKITKVKERLREILNEVDTKKLYMALYNNDIDEKDIPNYIVNMVLDDGIGKNFESFEKLVSQENLETIIFEYKENLKNRVSAIRLNALMGIKDNDNVVEGTLIKLRDYQQEALDNTVRLYEQDKRFVGVKLPTGAGKSFVAMAEMMRRKKENMVYFAPQEEILNQVQRHIVKYVLGKEVLNERHIEEMLHMNKQERKAFLANKIYNPTASVNELLFRLNKPDVSENEAEYIKSKILPRKTQYNDDVMDAIHTVFPHLDMCCYQSLTASKYEELMTKKVDFFVFDELHRTGATTWKTQIDKLLDAQQDAQIFGITATPVRDVDGVDTMEEMAKLYGGYSQEELISKEYYAAEMSLIDAMQRKIVVEPIIVPFNRNLTELPEYQEISDAIKELEKTGDNPRLLNRLRFNLSQMDEIAGQALSKNDKLIGIDEVLKDNIDDKKKNGRFIVFIPQKPNDFKGTTEEYVKAKIAETSKYFEGVNREMMIEYLLSNRAGSDKANTKAIANFESIDDDRLKLLYAINKLNEGVHVDDISGEIMLRPIGSGSNILYFQQIGRVIYAIDPENPPKEEDIPIIFDVYNNYIARDLDKEVNYTTTISDLSRLQEIVNWINRHETLPDIDSDEKNEVNKAMFLRKIQKKYGKYLNGIENPNLTATEIYEIQKIIELGMSFNLFDLDLPDRSVENEAFDFRVRTFEVVGEQKRFLDIYEESKKEINKTVLRNKETDQIKIRNGVGIFKVLSSYGLAITDESFEQFDKSKEEVTLAEYIAGNFEVEVARDIFDDLKMTYLDAEDVEVYKVFDYLRRSFMSSKSNVRNHFNYYDITELRRCGILKENGKYIPVIDELGFVHEKDEFGDGYRAPKAFVNLNVITGTRFDEEGYDIDGYDKDGYDRQNYDKLGFDRRGFRRGELYNKFGFDRDGVHKDTLIFLDPNNFDFEGYYWASKERPDGSRKLYNTGKTINEYGFDREGNYYEQDENGEYVYKGKVDPYGFRLGQEENDAGFLRNGKHSKTGEYWDEYGFDIDKIYWKKIKSAKNHRIKSGSILNEYGFARDGFYYEHGENGELVKKGRVDPLGFKFEEEYSSFGFNRQEIHRDTNEYWDPNGFDTYGFYWEIDKVTGERVRTDRKLDLGNFDREGYFWKQNEDGEWERKGFKNDQGLRRGQLVSEEGFRADGTHNKTGTKWDPNGFDVNGIYWKFNEETKEREITGLPVNEYGFNRYGKYCEKNEEGEWIEIGEEDPYGFRFGRPYNDRGFDRKGIHYRTEKPWDPNGFDFSGNYWEKIGTRKTQTGEDEDLRHNTGKKLDPYGFNHELYYCEPGIDGELVKIGPRDRLGFSFGADAINERGFRRNGIHAKTNREFDSYYFDIYGNYWEADEKDPLNDNKRRRTNRKHDEYGKDVSGHPVDGIEQKEEDKFGFKRGNEINTNGFYRNGIHSKTNKPWNERGFGIDGYYWALKPDSKKERVRTNVKYDEEHLDNGGHYCFEYEGRFIKLFRFRNQFHELVKKQEKTIRTGVEPFENGGFDAKGFWWELDKKTGQYIPTGSKINPHTGWDANGYDGNGNYIAHDDYGFKKSGIHSNGTYTDDRGFDSSYRHRITGRLYDENYFDIDGYYWEYDSYTGQRIKTNSRHNELGATWDGECIEDINGYDDIGMQNGATDVNEKFKLVKAREYVAREMDKNEDGTVDESKKVFRKTERGYFFRDTDCRFNPEDGLDFEGYARNGYNSEGKTRKPEYRTYKVLQSKDDKYFDTYPEIDELEEYEYEYNPYSERKIRESILAERMKALEGLTDENIDNIRTNRLRYRKEYAPARLEAAQYIRDTWHAYDDEIRGRDGEVLVGAWEFERSEWRYEKMWQEYMKAEETISKRLKKEVELDEHGFDDDGIYYSRYQISGQDVAEATMLEYDPNHFDKEGYYWYVDEDTGEAFCTGRTRDDRGFDQNGFYHNEDNSNPPTLYDPSGYDRDGYDRRGFNARGIHKSGRNVDVQGFDINGCCTRNNGLRYDSRGFTVDGINIYTGTYVDLFGQSKDSRVETPRAYTIVNKEKHLNAYGINPDNGKNADGFLDPTVRFARYYFSEILEYGKEPDMLIKNVAAAYRISEEEMKLLADQKIFIALRGYPKMREEIAKYYEEGRAKVGKNYDMHIKVQKAHEKRAKERLAKVTGESQEGTGMDDDL